MSYNDFDVFVKKYKIKFKKISAATKREYAPEDVEIEAWLMAQTIWERKGLEIDFFNLAHVDLLFCHLYQKLVNYTEKQIRMAVRLDACQYVNDSAHDSHPLLNKLSNDTNDPLAVLERRETADSELFVSPHQSRAAAYVKLLDHYDNNIAQLASYLLISTSWCYRCFNKAKRTVEHQMQLPESMTNDFMPRTWRKFKLFRTSLPIQRSLTFPLPWEA